MPMDINELMEKGSDHQGRAFGAVSEDRKQLISWLHEHGAGTGKEIAEATGVTKAKTRLDVMRRDKIVDWKDYEGDVFYFLTEKGKARAEGKVEEKKTKKKK